MIEKRIIGLDEAKKALDAMVTHAGSDASRPVAMAVVDDAGNLVAFAKMDGTGLSSAAIAIRKAYTSARMSRDSGAWGEWIGKAGIDPAQFGDPQLCVFQGGICLKSDGRVVGGIGVSGRAAQEDEDIARIGHAAMGI